MKTNLLLIGIFVLLACFLTNCDQEDLTMDKAQVADSATERRRAEMAMVVTTRQSYTN